MRTVDRLGILPMVSFFTLLFFLVVFHLDIRSQVSQEGDGFVKWVPNRTPVHPPDPEINSDDPLYREMELILQGIRSLERKQPVAREAKPRMVQIALPLLYQMESLVLDMGEDLRARCFLIEVLSSFQEEAMRQFFFQLLWDSRESPVVREKALESVGTYLSSPVYRERTVRDLYSLLEFEPDALFREAIRNVLFGDQE